MAMCTQACQPYVQPVPEGGQRQIPGPAFLVLQLPWTRMFRNIIRSVVQCMQLVRNQEVDLVFVQSHNLECQSKLIAQFLDRTCNECQDRLRQEVQRIGWQKCGRWHWKGIANLWNWQGGLDLFCCRNSSPLSCTCFLLLWPVDGEFSKSAFGGVNLAFLFCLSSLVGESSGGFVLVFRRCCLSFTMVDFSHVQSHATQCQNYPAVSACMF